MALMTTVAGLEGVVAGESEICFIDGEEGILSYRGYNIHDLADNATFEEVVFLLWNGTLPNRSELAAFKSELAAEYALPDGTMAILRKFPHSAVAMDALRTGVSALGMFDPDTGDNSEPANHRKSLRLQAKIPTVVAAMR